VQHDVSEFIVIAPAGMGKAIEWAEPQLRSFLEGHFPLYRFRIEPYGPFADEEDFGIIPIMNRMPDPEEAVAHPDSTIMCHLDPTVIPEIRNVLRSFDPAGATTH
jgi:hypothetical protein